MSFGCDMYHVVRDGLIFVRNSRHHGGAVNAVNLTRASQQQPTSFHSRVIGIAEVLISNSFCDVRTDLKKIRTIDKRYSVFGRNASKARGEPNFKPKNFDRRPRNRFGIEVLPNRRNRRIMMPRIQPPAASQKNILSFSNKAKLAKIHR